MTRKAKIAIVCGEQIQPRLLNIFDTLRQQYETCLFIHHHEKLLEQNISGQKMRLFEAIPEMPGYMRGLEEELSSYDLAIGFESSRLATFQALRAARKYGLPLCVLVNEYLPYFYERYTQIRAIQFDVFNKAEHFFATSEAAALNLRINNISDDAISKIAPIVDIKRFRFDEDARVRFRQYLGLRPDDFVILFQRSLIPAERPDLLIKALGFLRRQMTAKTEQVKIFIVGCGSSAMDLKYLSYDLGIGAQTMFLHQDPEPFLSDLYAACDMIFEPRSIVSDYHQELPLSFLEALACGLIPVVGAGTVAAEFAGEFGFIYSEDQLENVAVQLQRAIGERENLSARRGSLAEMIANRHCPKVNDETFFSVIERCLTMARGRKSLHLDPEQVLTNIRAEVGRGAYSEAMVQIEEALLIGKHSSMNRADLWCLKGMVFAQTGQYEAAVSAYQESLGVNDTCSEALRALGHLALQTHDHEAALAYYRKALALNESDGEAMLGIAMVFRRLALQDEAAIWLEKCVVGFNMPKATYALAQTCLQSSRPTQAIAILVRVLDSVGESQPLMLTLGQLYLSVGRLDEGQAMLQKALASA